MKLFTSNTSPYSDDFFVILKKMAAKKPHEYRRFT